MAPACWISWWGPGGHSTLFQVGVAWISKVWGLRTATCHWQGACELKIPKFGGLRAKIWAKIKAVEAKISKFYKKGVLWTNSFAWNGPLQTAGEAWKGGLQGCTSPYPLSGSVPPPWGEGIMQLYQELPNALTAEYPCSSHSGTALFEAYTASLKNFHYKV